MADFWRFDVFVKCIHARIIDNKKKHAFIVCLDLNQPGLYFCIVLLSTAEAWVGLDVSTAGVEVSAEETRN